MKLSYPLATRALLLALLLIPPITAQTAYTSLEPGTLIERDLKGGETHEYGLPMKSGDFVQVKTEQKGIDVGVRLLDPNGAMVIQADGLKGAKGEKPIAFVADLAGQYRVSVEPLKPDAASGKYEITLVASRTATTEDMAEAARFMGNQAKQLFRRNTPRSRELALRSLSLAERAGDRRIVASQYNLIANTYLIEGDLKQGIEYHDRALRIRREIDDQDGIGASLNNLGIAYLQLGHSDKAIESFGQASELFLKRGHKVDAAMFTYNIGIAYRGRGDYGRATAYFQKSSEMYKEAGSDPMPAGLAVNFGGVYRELGNFEQATAYFERALAGFEKAKDVYGQYQAMDGLGQANLQAGSYTKAIEYLEKALKLEGAMNARADMVDTLRSIGEAYFKNGDVAAAQSNYERAVKIAVDQADPNKKIAAMISISRLQLAGGKTAEAIASAEQAKAIFESMIGPGSRPDLWDALGRAYLTAGNFAKARTSFERAVADVESVRTNAGASVENEASYFSERIAPFHALTAMLISQGKNALALEYAERARSRALIETLQNGKVDNSGAMTAIEKQHEQQLRIELMSLNTRVARLRSDADADKATKLLEEQRLKRLEFEDFKNRTYSSHPELRTDRGEMKPIALEETAKLFPNRSSALLEFVVAKDSAFLLTVTLNVLNQPTVNSFRFDASNLAKKVEDYRTKVAVGDLDVQELSRSLYDLLLKPAASQLAGRTNLIVVPDGPLWDLPFQSLVDDKGKFLAEKAAISYAPSLTALREMKKKAESRKPQYEAGLLAFGNPTITDATRTRVQSVFSGENLGPIPEAGRLVDSLAKMYGPKESKVFTGAAAREESAKSEAPKHKIVQFATHGILNNVSPMYSHLVLAQNDQDPNEDGLLEAWELKDLDLKADMVILSACDTARGRISNGEGVIGMTWAAFIAGAPTTVASQWKVESKSTTELMLEFHRQLLTGKVSKAEALRRAELKVMKMPGYKHPSYWAGFVIVGDGS